MTETTEPPMQTADAPDIQLEELKRRLQQRDARIASLHKHIANLEQRLAALEHGRSFSSAELSEDLHVRQIKGEPKRRWFSDSDLDLIVWLDKDEPGTGQKSSSAAQAKPRDSRMAQRLRALYGARTQEEQPDRIIGFQLCYDKTGAERALTWQEAVGYSHYTVDAGEEGSRSKRTPLLVADSNFEPMRIAELFRQHSAQIDQQIAQFVYDKIVECPLLRTG